MSTQKEFEDAVKVIQKLLKEDRIIAKRITNLENVDKIMITLNGAYSGYYGDSDKGDNCFHIDTKPSTLIIREQIDVLIEEREFAKKVYDSTLNNVANANYNYNSAKEKLLELDKKLAELGKGTK